MLSAFEVGMELDEMIQAGLTIKPADLTPGEIAVLLGFNRGKNRSNNEDKKPSSAQTEQEKQKSRERYKGRD